MQATGLHSHFFCKFEERIIRKANTIIASMKITLICIGKTDQPYLKSGIEEYLKRIKHYVDFQMTIIPDIKNRKSLSPTQQQDKEATLILKHIRPSDHVILLDEKGTSCSSVELASLIEGKMLNSVPNIIFIIGGPFGFGKALYDSTKRRLSLSKLTFSHQMIRLFFVEQIYRAMTIIKHESYHHI